MGELSALLSKNFIIWKRNKASLIAEYVIIVAFALVLGIFKHYSDTTTYPDKSYLNDAYPHTPTNKSAPYPLDYAYMFGDLVNRFEESNGTTYMLMKNCNFSSSNQNKRTGGYIALAPLSPITQQIGQLFTGVFGYSVKYFDDNNTIQDYVKMDGYGDPDPDNPGMNKSLCLGLNFTSMIKGDWRYSVYYNVSGNPGWYDLMDLNNQQVIKFQKEILNDYHWINQINSGFGVLQELITNLIVKMEVASNTRIDSNLVLAPVQGYTNADLYTKTNNGDLSFFIMFPLLINFLKLIYNIVNEKEKRITENLRNMGMSLYKHYASWIIFNTLVLGSTTLLWALITKLVIFQASNFILIWWLIFLPGLALQSMSFFISAFFIKAKSGIISGLVFLFLSDLVRTARQAIVSPSHDLIVWMSLSPTYSAASTSSIMVLLESYSNGMGFDTYDTLVGEYKYAYMVHFQVGFAIIILILGIYLDQVWPSEIGIRRHPLFFIKDLFARNDNGVRRGVEEPLLEDGQESGQNFEPIEDLLKGQSADNKTLKIKNLRKIYPNGKVAVENLNLEMFSDQIFALLGHNGAGKTTTISMISGLLTQTSGSITLLGKDTREDAKHNRKILGVCPQTNPIYENLTCKEHLILYATIKKPDGWDKSQPVVSEQEIDNILQDLDLLEKKNYPACKLSGGQKRKLCVACAFIGGSKVILLDEPTSGMDTYARRYLWEMLKNYKKDRIIILSTHYMDEADYLGDRIGIMGKGKLITCGSSLFLKSRFGVGYDLTVVKSNPEVNTEAIQKVVQKYVPTAVKSGDISMEVKFQLPTTMSANFETLFKDFEDHKTEYGIQTFGISLTTLEEVFLKVASLEAEDQKENSKDSVVNHDKIAQTIADENFELNHIREHNPTKIFLMHFKALCKKRFIYFKRDKRGLVCEIFLPIIIILLGMSMTKIQFIREPGTGPLQPSILGDSKVWIGSSDTYPELNQAIDSVFSNYSGVSLYRSPASSNVTFDQSLRDTPVPNRYYSVFVDKFDIANRQFHYSCFVNTTAPYDIQLCFNMMDNVLYKAVSDNQSASINVDITPFVLTKLSEEFENTAVGFISAIIVSIAFAFIPASLIVIIVKERENNVKHQQIVSGVSILAYWLSNLIVDFLKYLVPAAATILILFMYDVETYIGSKGISATLSLFILFGIDMILFTYLFSFLFKSPSKAQFIIFLMSYMCGSILTMLSFILRLLENTRSLELNFIEWVLRFIPIYDLSFGLFSMANSHIWMIAFQLPQEPGPWNYYTALWQVIYLVVLSVVYFYLILLIEYKGNSISKTISTNTEDKLNYEGEDEDVTKERESVEKDENFAVRVLNLMVEYVIYRDGFFKKKRPESTKLAVKGVSFGVKKGECFGLLGTNGAGKTSTFKVLSGEIMPNHGTATIAGYNVETDMKTIGSLIGYCPQFDALLENLTAREHLELYAAIKGIPYHMREKLIENKLHQLNLKSYENVLAGTYSGGNKRKLSVALALIGNPPIILLDEPSSGMDPEARRFMWSIVSQISTQNKTSSVILTTHSMEEAEALSSKLAIMVEGRVKCIGPVQQLKSKYGKGFEIEVKVRLPTKVEIGEMKAKLGLLAGQDKVENQEKAIQILRELGFKNAEYEFCPKGKCEQFMIQLSRGSDVFLYTLIEFAHVNARADEIFDFLKTQFSDVSLIESLNTFFRFKIDQTVKLSTLFGAIESNQSRLAISQYSVKQTTIEQIFINFANLREEKTDE